MNIDNRLPCFGEPVGILAIDDGPGFIKSVHKRAVFRVWPGLIKISPHAEVTIRKGEQRLGLSEKVRIKRLLDDSPIVNGINVRWGANGLVSYHLGTAFGKFSFFLFEKSYFFNNLESQGVH
jgi:hypothetical protein